MVKLPCVIAVAVLMTSAGCTKPRHQSEVHPRDADLLLQFSSARPRLEAIVAIFESCSEADSLSESGFSRFSPKENTPVSCAIPEPYRSGSKEILRQIGVKEVHRRADGSIGFLVSQQPEVTSVLTRPLSGKGYEYMKKAREPEVNSLESIECHGDGAFHVRRIDGDWHLFLYCYS